MDKLTEIATNYGPLGIFVLGEAWFILYLMKQHREERQEMLETMKRQHQEVIDVTKNSNEITRNNTTVLTEISTIIKNQRR